jgi:16S rRNA (adenine1518-N6/adenine1519-N6)-dimethyltransferase
MNLDSLPSLREIIDRYNLRAEKKLGQNFILDQNITDKIARSAGDISNHHIIEIGAGPGGLTRSILGQNPLSLTSIEFDPRAIEALQSLVTVAQGKFNLIRGDALQTDLVSLIPLPRIIIANLPYNISTVLLLKWLSDIFINPHSYDRMILMFQKEVAERLVATPHSKEYGRLSVMTGWLCEAQILFDLPPHIFSPPPKVTSSIVEFRPRLNRVDKIPFETLETILADGFNQRRKMIRSSMKKYLPAIDRTNIDSSLRAENLSVSDFIKIAEQI